MLDIQNVSKAYGKKTALSNVSLSLSEGIYGLLGPNGAGKSTLMNMITGNLRPDSGEICWNGTEIKKAGAAYRRILGYAPQQQGLYDSFSGRRFLSYMGTLKCIPKKELEKEISRVASYVNLSQALDRPISSYSGGMKQRLLIAQAVMGTPQLIVMDEPTAGLDPKERVRLRERIRTLAEGKIILIATHVVSDIQTIAKKVIILKAGEVIEQDTVAALCEKYRNAADLEEVYMEIFGEGAEYEESDSF